MAKLWQRTRTAEGASQLHDISLTDLSIKRPSVIFLSGFFTTDGQPGYIAGALKRMEEMMAARPGEQKPVDIYAWSHSGLSNIFNLAAYNLKPHSRASQPAQALARGVIMPLVLKDYAMDGDGNVTGTPLPLEEAKANLRNITFFGYSAGTILGQECFNASMKMMQRAGFEKDKAREALQEVVMVSTGNISRPSKEKDRFTTVYLVASNDLIIKAKNRIWAPLKTLFARFARRLNIKKLSATSAFVSAAVSKKKWEWRNKDGKTFREKINPLLPSWTFLRSYHELPHYITHDENLSQFAKIVQYALTNAVNRTEKPDPLALLSPPPSVAEETAAPYRARIAQAMVPDNVRI